MNDKDSAPQTDPKTASPAKKGGNKMIFLVLGCVAFFCVATICGAGIILLLNSDEEDVDTTVEDSSEEEEVEEDEVEEEETVMVAYDEFVGEYVTGLHPDGWTIVEYEDAEGGYGLLADGDYVGLTAIVVRNPLGEDVFTIQGANGIGGVDACEEVYSFDDSSSSYINDKLDVSTFYYPGVVEVPIGDSYVPFSLLGKRGRLVSGGNFYWDSTDSVATFDPHCSAMMGLPEDVGLSFDYSYLGVDTTVPSYIIAVEDGVLEIEAEIMVEIFESMEVL